MRTFIGTLVLCSSIVAFAGWKTLNADVNFGNRDSGFYVLDGGRLNNGSSNFVMSGTLGLAGSPLLTGNDIYFSGGILEQDGVQSVLDCVFKLSEDGAVALTGNQSLHGQASSSFAGVAVSGTGNLIDGVLTLTGPIVLADSSAALSLGIENPVTQNIELNGGTLTLVSDLRLAKNAAIIGAGTVDQQDFQIISDTFLTTVPTSTSTSSSTTTIIYVNTPGTTTSTTGSTSTVPPVLTGGGSQSNGQVVQFTNSQAYVTHNRPINITAKNVVIDGAGGNIAFVGAVGQRVGLGSEGGPLFKVADNVTVTLRNVTLTNITQDTFALGQGSVLALDENVTLDFGGDVFLTSGTIKLVNSSNIIGSSTVVRMRGINGRKKLILAPTVGNQTTMIDLNNNSLVLQNMELVGSPLINPNGRMASIALAGGAIVDVSASTGLNFDVEDTDNSLVLTQDGLTLSGAFSFDGLAAENTLAVRFALNAPVGDKSVTMIDADGRVSYVPVKKGNPLVVFDGDTGIFLTNQSTLSGLVFEDQSVSIANGLNTNTNAFVIDQNSYLMGFDLEVLCHPIKQQSARFVLEARTIAGLGIDQSFVRVRKSNPNRVATAFGKMLEHKRANKPVAKMRPVVKPQVTQAKVLAALAKTKKQNKLLTRSPEGLMPEEMDYEYVRSFAPPSQYARTVVATTVTNIAPESGYSLYKSATVYDFNTSNATVSSVTMETGAQLHQQPDSTLLVDGAHTLNVTGLGNKLIVTGDAVIDLTSIGFDASRRTSLIIQGHRVGAALPTITLSGTLNLVDSAALLFEGVGRVILSDGTLLSFNGSSSQAQPLFGIGNGITLSVADKAKAYVGGIGRFEVADGGQLVLNNGAHLSFADVPPSIASSRVHSIDFSIQRNGVVTVGGDTDAAVLRFAGNGNVSFAIDNASLIVGAFGLVGFNIGANSGVQRGLLQAFKLKYANVILRGRLGFGPNMYDSLFKDLTTQVSITETQISGGGTIVAHNQDPVKMTTNDVSGAVSLRGASVTGIDAVVPPANILKLINAA